MRCLLRFRRSASHPDAGTSRSSIREANSVRVPLSRVVEKLAMSVYWLTLMRLSAFYYYYYYYFGSDLISAILSKVKSAVAVAIAVCISHDDS